MDFRTITTAQLHDAGIVWNGPTPAELIVLGTVVLMVAVLIYIAQGQI